MCNFTQIVISMDLIEMYVKTELLWWRKKIWAWCECVFSVDSMFRPTAVIKTCKWFCWQNYCVKVTAPNNECVRAHRWWVLMKGVDVVYIVYLLWKGRPERSKHVTDNRRPRSDEVMTSQTITVWFCQLLESWDGCMNICLIKWFFREMGGKIDRSEVLNSGHQEFSSNLNQTHQTLPVTF